MGYCTASDVRLIIDTTLTDAEIESIIETSDAYIDKLLGSQSSTDKLIKRLSMLLTAKIIKTRDPQSQAIGEYRESAGNILEVWEREIREIMRLYRRSFKVV
jgi:hypothetical protein